MESSPRFVFCRKLEKISKIQREKVAKRAKEENAECRDISELCRDKSSRQPAEVCHNYQISVTTKITKIAHKNSGRISQHFTTLSQYKL